MKRRKSHTKPLILLILSIEILLIIGFLAYIQLRPMVVKAVSIEAGTNIPDVKKFLIFQNRKGSFVTDVNTLDIHNPGVYEIDIRIGKKIHSSKLKIIDTIAPTAVAVNQIASLDEDLKAEAFVTDVKDATTVKVSFKNKPITSVIGDQEVTILLEDSGKNLTELRASLSVLDIKKTITVEAGSQMNITAADFIDNNEYDISFVTDLSKLDISKPTVHKIILKVDGKEVPVNIEVVDTTAPTASFLNQNIWNDQLPPAANFVAGIRDASQVEVSYKVAPDLTILGDQNISIVLEDAYGNRTEHEVIATVSEDTQPPEIIGVRDKTVYIGESIAYRKDISVTDNKDTDLKVSVDSSKVNLKKEGIYEVIYTAEDSSENQAKVVTKVTVIKFTVSEDKVYEMADHIIEDIFTKDQMTNVEKAQAIYTWVKKHVGYTGHSDKSDWLAEAYRGMTKGEGDCFTFYAVSQALLTRAGIDNMRVTRVGGRTQHFWNLINCGDGWYHFDTCPNKDHMDAFMLTDKEVEEYTKKRGNHYYSFDKTLYPATPEE